MPGVAGAAVIVVYLLLTTRRSSTRAVAGFPNKSHRFLSVLKTLITHTHSVAVFLSSAAARQEVLAFLSPISNLPLTPSDSPQHTVGDVSSRRDHDADIDIRPVSVDWRVWRVRSVHCAVDDGGAAAGSEV